MEQPLFVFACMPVIFILVSLFGFQPRFITRKYGLKNALDNSDTKECTETYRKKLYQTMGILFVCSLPNFLLCYYYPVYLSLSFSYMLIWAGIWFYVSTFRLMPRYLTELWTIQNKGTGAAKTPPNFINWPLKIAAFFYACVTIVGIGLVLYLDFGTVNVAFKGNEVSISAPLFSSDFSKSDILSVTQTNALPPHGKKIMGSNTPKSSYGYFSFDGIDKAELLVNHGIKPIIVIRLKDRTIFLNGKTTEETESYYRELTDEGGTAAPSK